MKFVVRSSCSCESTRMSRTATDDVGAASSSSSSCMTTSENNSSSKKREEAAAVSVVTDLGVYSSTCGYCKSASRTSVTQGLHFCAPAIQNDFFVIFCTLGLE